MMLKLFYLTIIISGLTSLAIGQHKITLEDIYASDKFYPDAIQNIHWNNDRSGVLFRESNKFRLNHNILFFDLKSSESKTFLNISDIEKNSNYENFTSTHVIWSPDEKFLLFTGLLPARDKKSGGDFFLYDLSKESVKPVNNFQSSKMLAQFSPNSKYIGYVKENNLFYVYVHDLLEKQLTVDGSENILNGHFDWIYEEEFDIITGWQWSPNSKYIAYWQIDQSQVPEFEIPLFNSLYPKSIKQKYPKAGQKNSKVKIGVVNIESKVNKWFRFEEEDIYIPRIQWLPDGENLSIIKLNRLQNKLEMHLANINSGKMNSVFEESNNAWIEIRDDLKFLTNSKQFIWTSEKSGFRHVYLNNYQTGESFQITSGSWQIREIVAVDESKERIYFTATKESELENHLYSIQFNGKNLTKISQLAGWHEVSFSPNCDYFIDEYSAINIPSKSMLFDSNGKLISTLIENNSDELDKYEFNQPEFLKIPINDKVQLNGWMLKPPDFNEDKKYPLIIYTYGGPGSQKVKNEWRTISNWYRLLSQNGIIVAYVDNRGTDGRGADFKHYVYKKLGQLDVQDQIQAAEYFASLDYIDEDRIGMYGWSYGGYMSLMCLMQGNDIFKLAVSVAPVTDWRFYDTIYTESFMQTPQLNKEGYELGSVMNYVNLLEGKLLLIHGMTDDNVHYQNSVELVEELIDQNKQFDTMFYPGRKHGISGRRVHVFTKITDFILENL